MIAGQVLRGNDHDVLKSGSRLWYEEVIREYIRNQEQEDASLEQMNLWRR
jgi:hypothetical protein